MSSHPKGARIDKFLKEFIQKLDLGEFDGKIQEVLKDLSKEELVKIAEHLATRGSLN